LSVCYVDSRLHDAIYVFFDGCDLDGSGKLTRQKVHKVLDDAERKYLEEKMKRDTKKTGTEEKSGDDVVSYDANKQQFLTRKGSVISRYDSIAQEVKDFKVSEFQAFFGQLFKSDDEEMVLEEFESRIHKGNHGHVVQVFLQFIVCARMKVRLGKEDFLVGDHVTTELRTEHVQKI